MIANVWNAGPSCLQEDLQVDAMKCAYLMSKAPHMALALQLIAIRTRELLQRDAEGMIEDFETEFKNLAGAIIETAENI